MQNSSGAVLRSRHASRVVERFDDVSEVKFIEKKGLSLEAFACAIGILMILICLSLLSLLLVFIYKELKSPPSVHVSSSSFILEPVSVYRTANEEKQEMQRLIVLDGRILAIEDANKPCNIENCDNYDKFPLPSIVEWIVVPGLIDSQTYLPQDNRFHVAEYISLLYLINGVTSVVGDVGIHPTDYITPRTIPCLHISATSNPGASNSFIVKTNSQIQEAVKESKSKYSCITIDNEIETKLFDEILSLANEAAIPIISDNMDKIMNGVLYSSNLGCIFSCGESRGRIANSQTEILLSEYLWKQRKQDCCNEHERNKRLKSLMEIVATSKKAVLSGGATEFSSDSLIKEMETMKEHKVSSRDIWDIASSRSASLLMQKKLGFIEEGNFADFLLYRGDVFTPHSKDTKTAQDLSIRAIIASGNLIWKKQAEEAIHSFEEYLSRTTVHLFNSLFEYM